MVLVVYGVLSSQNLFYWSGQLSDSLKSFARQNKYLQDCRHLCCQNISSLLRFTGHLSDRLKAFAGQNENLLVLSGSPALFAKTGCLFMFITFIEICTVYIIYSNRIDADQTQQASNM